MYFVYQCYYYYLTLFLFLFVSCRCRCCSSLFFSFLLFSSSDLAPLALLRLVPRLRFTTILLLTGFAFFFLLGFVCFSKKNKVIDTACLLPQRQCSSDAPPLLLPLRLNEKRKTFAVKKKKLVATTSKGKKKTVELDEEIKKEKIRKYYTTIHQLSTILYI